MKSLRQVIASRFQSDGNFVLVEYNFLDAVDEFLFQVSFGVMPFIVMKRLTENALKIGGVDAIEVCRFRQVWNKTEVDDVTAGAFAAPIS